MSSWRVYVAPLIEKNTFGDWEDITKYSTTDGLSDVKIEAEQNNFTVGLAKNSSISISLRNTGGKFSDERRIGTMFKYRRAGSKIKLTYFDGDDFAICGAAICGDAILGDESEVFQGVISGETPSLDVSNDTISLDVLGFESILENEPFDIATVNTADAVKTLIHNILSAPNIVAVCPSDFASWTVGVNLTLDNVLEFQEIDTAKEALEKLLEISNSILYVKNGLFIVSNKTASTELMYSFYGQASDKGIENIQTIAGYNDGLARCFNYWRWNPDAIQEGETPAEIQQNTSSVDNYGLRKNDSIGLDAIDLNATRALVLQSYLSEYGEPKREFNLTAPINQSLIGLILMDRVNIDYPLPVFPADENTLPIWNTSTMTWGEFTWPNTLFEFSIDDSLSFKIISVSYSIRNNLVTFRLREV